MRKTRRRQDFVAKALKEGRRFHAVGFSLFYHPGIKAEPIVLVGQRVDKRATVRNRIRRRLKHLWQDFAPRGALVVLGKKEALRLPFASLKAEVVRLKRKVGFDEKNSRQPN